MGKSRLHLFQQQLVKNNFSAVVTHQEKAVSCGAFSEKRGVRFFVNMPRQEGDEEIPWEVAEVRHPYAAVSFVENDRGIGLVDTADAIREGRMNRASGDMALHMLEVSEAILVSAREHRYVETKTTFSIPEAMPQVSPDV